MSLVDRALSLHQSGRLPEAIKMYRRVLRKKPESFGVQHYLGVALLQSGDLPAACAAFQRAVAINDNDPGCWSNYGLAQYHAEDYAGAKSSLERSLALNPNNAPALNNLGMVCRALGRSEEALACFEKSNELSPDNPGTLHNLGGAYHEASRIDDAIQAFKHAIDVSGGEPETYASLSAAYFAKSTDMAEPALDACRKAVEGDPFNESALEQFKSIKWFQNKPTEMYELLEHACESYPGEPRAYLQFAHALVEDTEFERAVPVARRAIELAPDIALAHGRLGAALSGVGQFDQATDAFENAVTLGQGEWEIYERYGQHLLNVGDFHRAADILKRGHEINPRRSGILGFLSIAMREIGDNKLPWLVDHDAHLFPQMINPPTGYDSVDAFNEELHTTVAKYHEDAPHPDNQSMRGGTQNTGSLLHYPDPVIGAFKEAITAAVHVYIDRLEGRTDHPLERYINRNFRFTDVWSTILHGSGYDGSHIHNEGWLSGVYYVLTPDLPEELWEQGEGCIQFGAPPTRYVTERNCTQHVIRPEPGKVVLFPSYFWHGVQPFTVPGARHAIAFDVI